MSGPPYVMRVLHRVPMQHPSVGRVPHSIFMLGNRLSMSNGRMKKSEVFDDYKLEIREE